MYGIYLQMNGLSWNGTILEFQYLMPHLSYLDWRSIPDTLIMEAYTAITERVAANARNQQVKSTLSRAKHTYDKEIGREVGVVEMYDITHKHKDGTGHISTPTCGKI